MAFHWLSTVASGEIGAAYLPRSALAAT